MKPLFYIFIYLLVLKTNITLNDTFNNKNSNTIKYSNTNFYQNTYQPNFTEKKDLKNLNEKNFFPNVNDNYLYKKEIPLYDQNYLKKFDLNNKTIMNSNNLNLKNSFKPNNNFIKKNEKYLYNSKNNQYFLNKENEISPNFEFKKKFDKNKNFLEKNKNFLEKNKFLQENYKNKISGGLFKNKEFVKERIINLENEILNNNYKKENNTLNFEEGEKQNLSKEKKNNLNEKNFENKKNTFSQKQEKEKSFKNFKNPINFKNTQKTPNKNYFQIQNMTENPDKTQNITKTEKKQKPLYIPNSPFDIIFLTSLKLLKKIEHPETDIKIIHSSFINKNKKKKKYRFIFKIKTFSDSIYIGILITNNFEILKNFKTDDLDDLRLVFDLPYLNENEELDYFFSKKIFFENYFLFREYDFKGFEAKVDDCFFRFKITGKDFEVRNNEVRKKLDGEESVLLHDVYSFYNENKH